MSTKARSRSKDKKAASRNSETYNRLYMGTTSSKMKERPAFNLDTSISYNDVPNPKTHKKPTPEKDDHGRAWTDSLRS